MKTKLARFAAAGALATCLLAAPTSKPRIFITETTTPYASADAAVGDVKGSLAFTGGTSPQNIAVMRAFERHCPAVVITADRDKADYLVQFDHEPINPTTLFTHENKVAVFDKNEDLIYTNATRLLSSGVKDACRAITRAAGSGKKKLR
jgi:hypothetical protein